MSSVLLSISNNEVPKKSILYLIILMHICFAFLITTAYLFSVKFWPNSFFSCTATTTQSKTHAWTHNDFDEFSWGVLWDHVQSVPLFWFIPANNLTVLVCITLISKTYMMGQMQIKIWTESINTFQNFSNDLYLGKGPCLIMFKYFDMHGILLYKIDRS